MSVVNPDVEFAARILRGLNYPIFKSSEPESWNGDGWNKYDLAVAHLNMENVDPQSKPNKRWIRSFKNKFKPQKKLSARQMKIVENKANKPIEIREVESHISKKRKIDNVLSKGAENELKKIAPKCKESTRLLSKWKTVGYFEVKEINMTSKGNLKIIFADDTVEYGIDKYNKKQFSLVLTTELKRKQKDGNYTNVSLGFKNNEIEETFSYYNNLDKFKDYIPS